jgi:hypothetical protein
VTIMDSRSFLAGSIGPVQSENHASTMVQARRRLVLFRGPDDGRIVARRMKEIFAVALKA